MDAITLQSVAISHDSPFRHHNFFVSVTLYTGSPIHSALPLFLCSCPAMSHFPGSLSTASASRFTAFFSSVALCYDSPAHSTHDFLRKCLGMSLFPDSLPVLSHLIFSVSVPLCFGSLGHTAAVPRFPLFLRKLRLNQNDVVVRSLVPGNPGVALVQAVESGEELGGSHAR